MPVELLMPVAFALIIVLVIAGIVLRVMASFVQHYATHQGTPHLSTGVRIIGLCFLAVGLPLAVIAGLFSAFEAETMPDSILSVCGLVLAGFLCFSGGYVWYWGTGLRQQLFLGQGESQPAAPRGLWTGSFPSLLPKFNVEAGATHVILLSWCAAILSLAFCAAAAFEPWVMIVTLIPLELICFGMLLILEGLLWWNRRIHLQLLRFWQVYLAVESRRPLAAELEFLSHYAWGKERRRFLEASDLLHSGSEVEDAFVQPMFLSGLEGAEMATSLKTGRMPEMLREMLRKRAAFSKELPGIQDRTSSTLYVWLLVSITFLVVSFVMYWIIPKFKKIFEDFGTDLPVTTKMLVQGCVSFANYWYVYLPFTFLCLAGYTVLSLIPSVGSFPQLRLAFARFWPRVCMPDVLRSLALAAEAQIPLAEALVPFVRRQFHIPLHNRLIRVQEAIFEGGDCWQEMARERLLTAGESHLLQSAQNAGNLPWALRTLGQRFEQRWYFRVLFWMEFLQPVMLISIGAVVSLIIIGFFLPLVKLLNDFS